MLDVYIFGQASVLSVLPWGSRSFIATQSSGLTSYELLYLESGGCDGFLC